MVGALAPALYRTRSEADEEPDQSCTCGSSRSDARPADGLLEHGRCLLEPTRHEERLAMLRQESQSLRMVRGQERGGPSEE